jgi:hypothetical protein
MAGQRRAMPDRAGETIVAMRARGTTSRSQTSAGQDNSKSPK